MNQLINNHIFQNHLLRQQHLIPLLKIQTSVIWTSVFFLFCLCILVFLKVTSYPKVLKIVQSTFNSNALHELEREETKSFKSYSVILSFFALINLSFLLYKLNAFYKLVFIETDLLFQFGIITIIVLIFVIVKTGLNQFISIVSDNYKTLSDYSYNSIKINQTFGLFLFPWLVLAELTVFNPLIFISSALVVLALAVIYRWYKGAIIGLIEERIGLLQLFVYFCVLEILPIAVLIKYIIETF